MVDEKVNSTDIVKKKEKKNLGNQTRKIKRSRIKTKIKNVRRFNKIVVNEHK